MTAEIMIRPIKTEEDYRMALEEIAPLFDAKPESLEEDRLVVLGMLIEDYEAKHYPIDPPDPVAMLEHYLDRKGMEQRDLEPYLGGLSAVAAVLNRERPLTLDMIRRLHDGLGISADVLIQAYPLLKAA